MKRISLVLAACALAATACSPQAEEPAVAAPEAAAAADAHGGMEGGMAAPAPGDSVATQGYKASMNTMMEAMPPLHPGTRTSTFMTQRCEVTTSQPSRWPVWSSRKARTPKRGTWPRR